MKFKSEPVHPDTSLLNNFLILTFDHHHQTSGQRTMSCLTNDRINWPNRPVHHNLKSEFIVVLLKHCWLVCLFYWKLMFYFRSSSFYKTFALQGSWGEEDRNCFHSSVDSKTRQWAGWRVNILSDQHANRTHPATTVQYIDIILLLWYETICCLRLWILWHLDKGSFKGVTVKWCNFLNYQTVLLT